MYQTCKQCGHVKSLDDFYVMQGYRRYECKECSRKRMIANQIARNKLPKVLKDKCGCGKTFAEHQKEVAQMEDLDLNKMKDKCVICGEDNEGGVKRFLLRGNWCGECNAYAERLAKFKGTKQI